MGYFICLSVTNSYIWVVASSPRPATVCPGLKDPEGTPATTSRSPSRADDGLQPPKEGVVELATVFKPSSVTGDRNQCRNSRSRNHFGRCCRRHQSAQSSCVASTM